MCAAFSREPRVQSRTGGAATPVEVSWEAGIFLAETIYFDTGRRQRDGATCSENICFSRLLISFQGVWIASHVTKQRCGPSLAKNFCGKRKRPGGEPGLSRS
jgi:hypothetical protein